MISGKTILITGATSGIGKEVAMELAHQGNNVIFTARRIEAAEKIISDFDRENKSGKGSLSYIPCDLSSFQSVRDACYSFLKSHDRLDILINNAGIWNFEFKESKNTIEEIFHVNVLSPALLKSLLLPALTKSTDAKIIQTASGLHFGTIDFEDIEGRKKFSGFKAYRQSKLGVILLTRHWAKTLKDQQIGVYAVHPGLVDTRLGRDAGWFSNLFFRTFGIPAKKGAKTLIYLAITPKSELVSGEYYTKEKIKRITKESYDQEMAQKLEALVNQYLNAYL